MTHTESHVKIFFTKDYKAFAKIVGNRELNERKIKKIIDDIENGVDVLRYVPILVYEHNRQLHIIDGQHRFHVAKALQMPVSYVLAKDLTLHQIAKINSNTEKWKPKDFINCYTKLGNKNYSILNDIITEYKIPVSTALNLLEHGSVQGAGKAKRSFETGAFEVKCYPYTIELLNYANRFLFEGKRSRSFLIALHKILKAGKVSMDDIIDKVNAMSDNLTTADNDKKYLAQIEDIMSYKKQKRITVY